MSANPGVPVIDAQGVVIGTATVDMVSDGAVIHMDIVDGPGMAVIRAMAEGANGLSIRAVIPPLEQAKTVDR